MTTNRSSEHDEQALANQAWEKMQARLREEPVNPAWATWEERKATLHGTNKEEENSMNNDKPGISAAEDQPSVLNGQPSLPFTPQASKKKRKRAVRFAVAAAAAAVIVTAVTPAGNNALASILNTFTMQDTVVVQEDEMSNMMQMVYNANDHYESINAYGSFASTAEGHFDPEMTAEQIRAELGFEPISGPGGDTGRLSASIGSKTEMKLNVQEMNETLKKLGADHLFPAEADGKAITMTRPAAVIYNFGDDEAEWAVLNQSEMPTVEFDPSFPVEETMNAVINFPYLPQDLRTSLQKAAVSSGRLPLPMYANGKAQSFEVDGVNVTYTFNDSYSRNAFWIKNDQLFEFNAGENFKGGETGFLDFVKGLAAQ
ncbi:hypothetical protein [Saccharibacillus endophyticus]|uniref:DUF4367 domain-containing protein n=1 Tax=Saccharibacillus endophyticus TaxID=2060666 RepID=A0ABQ1ZJF4_9BACL|nr:hypothetical protein [Saccharibacillus endophyticus]GGH67744.1 hypothetical protein GCM10007362_01060 [Saccharibacillus endophyticus]